MSALAKKQKALQAIEVLKRRAAAGDPAARLRLRNIETTVMGAVRRRQQEALLDMVDRGMLDTNFEVPGAHTEPTNVSDDEIEFADNAMRQSEAAGGDGLAQKAALRDQKWLGLVDEAPFTRGNPPSILRGMAGNTVDLQVVQQNAAGNQAPPTAQVAWWPGDDADTMPVSIGLANYTPFSTLGTFIEAPTTVAPIRPYAIVQFGTRGSYQRIEVDLALGCEFSVPASQVTLQVGLDVVRNGLFTTFPTAKLGGSLSFRSIHKATRITRTVYIDGLAPQGAGISTFNIPLYAKTLEVLATTNSAAIAAPPFSVLIGDSNGSRIAAIVVAANTPMPLIDLPNDAAVVTIVNTDAGILNGNFRAVFGLSL